jgi:hypothetical protein
MRRDITGRPGHIHILTTYGSVCAIAPQPQEQRAGAGAAKTAKRKTGRASVRDAL